MNPTAHVLTERRDFGTTFRLAAQTVRNRITAEATAGSSRLCETRQAFDTQQRAF